jgi:hypothetical protein
MKISNLFKKNPKKSGTDSFLKMDEKQLTKVLGGTATTGSTTKQPPRGGVTASDSWPG